MDMISCQVSSISPSSEVDSCITLFLLCWGGHGDILLGQSLVQVPGKPRWLWKPVAESQRSEERDEAPGVVSGEAEPEMTLLDEDPGYL